MYKYSEGFFFIKRNRKLYVGCDAGGSGLGTHQALDSALNVIELVLEHINT